MARLMDRHQIHAEKIPLGRTKLREMVAAGEFPAPVVKGEGRGGDLWLEKHVDHFLERFIAAKKDAAAAALQRVAATAKARYSRRDRKRPSS